MTVAGVDFGTKTITVNAGTCDTDNTSYTMTLTSPAMLHGDHVVAIDFSAITACSNWSYIDPTLGTEIPINGVASFLFNTVHTQYVLKAQAVASGLLSDNQLLGTAPYNVTAIYAPQWADGYGQLQVTTSKNPVKCVTIVNAMTRAILCATPTPCVPTNPKVLLYYEVPAGDTCSTAITGIQVDGLITTNVGGACVSSPMSYALTYFAAPNRVWQQTHDSSSTTPLTAATSGIWATTVDSTFIVVHTTISTAGGSRTCNSNTVITGGDGYQITTGSGTVLTPNYKDAWISISGTTVVGGGIISPAYWPPWTGTASTNCGVNSNCSGTYRAQSWTAYNDSTCPRSPGPIAVPTLSAANNRDFLAAVVNQNGTTTITLSSLGMTMSVTYTWNVSKACGSGAITFTLLSATSPSGSGVIDYNVTDAGHSVSASQLVSIPGLGTNGGVLVNWTGNCYIANVPRSPVTTFYGSTTLGYQLQYGDG